METVGIDLGTTNTVVAAHQGPIAVRPLGEPERYALPSVVAFAPRGEVLVGEAARARRMIDPLNTVISSKRVIGQGWHSYAVQEYRRNYAIEIVQEGEGIAFKTRAGHCTPVSAAVHVLGALCRRAELAAESLSAVVSVPVAFGEESREATRQALLRTGFVEARCIEEPLATALCYLDRANLRHSVVYDLGGGTFDVVVLDCSVSPPRVMSRAGNAYLGGDDLDQAIANWIRDRALREHGWDAFADPIVRARLLALAEQLKIRLSAEPVVALDLNEVDPALPNKLPLVPLDRTGLWQLASPLVQRTFALCDEALAAASLTTKEIDAVFLAGGACRMKELQQAVGTYFGRRPRVDLDPMYVVATGANRAVARPHFSSLLT